MPILITLLVIIILAQAVYITSLERTHFGVYSPTAIRLRLWLYSLLRIRCTVIALDIRKMHELNQVLGYSAANRLVAKFLAHLRNGRDLIGQYGGDEFVIVIRNATNPAGICKRLTYEAHRLTVTNILPRQSDELAHITGGLVCGLNLAIGLVADTTNAAAAAQRAIESTETSKHGGKTSTDRATSGKPGNLISEVFL